MGWGGDQSVGGFGEEPGMKAQMINLIRSIRTVMRGKLHYIQNNNKTINVGGGGHLPHLNRNS